MDERIREVMSSVFGLDVSEIDATSSVDGIKAWDSLRHMNLIVALEEEFGIRFSYEDISAMTNFQVIRSVVKAELES